MLKKLIQLETVKEYTKELEIAYKGVAQFQEAYNNASLPIQRDIENNVFWLKPFQALFLGLRPSYILDQQGSQEVRDFLSPYFPNTNNMYYSPELLQDTIENYQKIGYFKDFSSEYLLSDFLIPFSYGSPKRKRDTIEIGLLLGYPFHASYQYAIRKFDGYENDTASIKKSDNPIWINLPGLDYITYNAKEEENFIEKYKAIYKTSKITYVHKYSQE